MNERLYNLLTLEKNAADALTRALRYQQANTKKIQNIENQLATVLHKPGKEDVQEALSKQLMALRSKGKAVEQKINVAPKERIEGAKAHIQNVDKSNKNMSKLMDSVEDSRKAQLKNIRNPQDDVIDAYQHQINAAKDKLNAPQEEKGGLLSRLRNALTGKKSENINRNALEGKIKELESGMKSRNDVLDRMPESKAYKARASSEINSSSDNARDMLRNQIKNDMSQSASKSRQYDNTKSFGYDKRVKDKALAAQKAEEAAAIEKMVQEDRDKTYGQPTSAPKSNVKSTKQAPKANTKPTAQEPKANSVDTVEMPKRVQDIRSQQNVDEYKNQISRPSVDTTIKSEIKKPIIGSDKPANQTKAPEVQQQKAPEVQQQKAPEVQQQSSREAPDYGYGDILNPIPKDPQKKGPAIGPLDTTSKDSAKSAIKNYADKEFSTPFSTPIPPNPTRQPRSPEKEIKKVKFLGKNRAKGENVVNPVEPQTSKDEAVSAIRSFKEGDKTIRGNNATRKQELINQGAINDKNTIHDIRRKNIEAKKQKELAQQNTIEQVQAQQPVAQAQPQAQQPVAQAQPQAQQPVAQAQQPVAQAQPQAQVPIQQAVSNPTNSYMWPVLGGSAAVGLGGYAMYNNRRQNDR